MKRLQDIADQVGVSRTTVSNVLHGNTKKVSKEMIRKISEILNQEGYDAKITDILHLRHLNFAQIYKNSLIYG